MGDAVVDVLDQDGLGLLGIACQRAFLASDPDIYQGIFTLDARIAV